MEHKAPTYNTRETRIHRRTHKKENQRQEREKQRQNRNTPDIPSWIKRERDHTTERSHNREIT